MHNGLWSYKNRNHCLTFTLNIITFSYHEFITIMKEKIQSNNKYKINFIIKSKELELRNIIRKNTIRYCDYFNVCGFFFMVGQLVLMSHSECPFTIYNNCKKSQKRNQYNKKVEFFEDPYVTSLKKIIHKAYKKFFKKNNICVKYC